MGFLLQPPLVRWKPFAQVSPVLIIKVFRSSGRPRGAKGQGWPFLARHLQSIVASSGKGLSHEAALRSPPCCFMVALLQEGETLQS